jgi:hypothetical protein
MGGGWHFRDGENLSSKNTLSAIVVRHSRFLDTRRREGARPGLLQIGTRQLTRASLAAKGEGD